MDNNNENQWINSDINLLGVRVRFLIFAFWNKKCAEQLNFLQGFLFCFWLFAFFMQNKNLMRARLGDKLEFYDLFSHHSLFVFSLILTCMISFENGFKSGIQWYNNQNNKIKTIEMTKLWTNLPSNHLKPQMYDSVYFRHMNLWKLCDYITFVDLELEVWDLVQCSLILFCLGSEILVKFGQPQPPRIPQNSQKHSEYELMETLRLYYFCNCGATLLGFGTLFPNIILLWIRNVEKNWTTLTP